MSWISDLITGGVKAISGYDISDYIPDLPSFGGGDSSSSTPGTGGKGFDWLGTGADLLKTGATLWNNNNALDQTSKQWEASFEYQKERDAANDAYRKDMLGAELQKAGIMAGAQVKAAGIAAAAQNKRTLADAYAQYNSQLGGQRDAQIRGFGQLGSAMAEPYYRRRAL